MAKKWHTSPDGRKVIVQTCTDFVAITLKQQNSLGWLLIFQPTSSHIGARLCRLFWTCCVFWTTTCTKTIYHLRWCQNHEPDILHKLFDNFEGRFAGSKQTQRDRTTTAKLGLKKRFVWSDTAVEVVPEILKRTFKLLKSFEVWYHQMRFTMISFKELLNSESWKKHAQTMCIP